MLWIFGGIYMGLSMNFDGISWGFHDCVMGIIDVHTNHVSYIYVHGVFSMGISGSD
jgi:hypothetical protein